MQVLKKKNQLGANTRKGGQPSGIRTPSLLEKVLGYKVSTPQLVENDNRRAAAMKERYLGPSEMSAVPGRLVLHSVGTLCACLCIDLINHLGVDGLICHNIQTTHHKCMR
jgi:hypothetical protein